MIWMDILISSIVNVASFISSSLSKDFINWSILSSDILQFISQPLLPDLSDLSPENEHIFVKSLSLIYYYILI